MIKRKLIKPIAALAISFAALFAGSSAIYATTTPLQNVLEMKAGDRFEIDGTAVGNVLTGVEADKDQISYVKQGMAVYDASTGGTKVGSVLSVDYSTYEITVKLDPNQSLLNAAFFEIGDNSPSGTAATLREHNNSVADNGSSTLETKDTDITVAGDGTVDTKMTSGPHGKFVSNTNACGRCHQLHAAQSSRLIRFKTDTSKNTIYGICTYCHSFNGQSTYDVRDGQLWDTNDGRRYATNGGGFERMLVVEGPANVATYANVTARHAVDLNDGNNEPVTFKAPGGSPTGEPIQLKCTACHQPHGTANDRLLVESVTQGTDTFYSYNKNQSGRGDFTGDTNPVKVVVTNPFGDEKTNYNKKMVDFCSQCHVDYGYGTTKDGGLKNSEGLITKTDVVTNGVVDTSKTSGARSSRLQTGKYDDSKYRHMMAMRAAQGLNGDNTVDNTYGFDANNLVLPLATVGVNSAAKGDGIVVCTTCHYAHGTFTNKAKTIKTYDEIDLGTSAATAHYGPSGTDGKLNVLGGFETAKNLRLDDRGVCQNCHNRNPDPTAPSLIDILDPSKVITDTTTANSTETLSGVKAKKVSATVNGVPGTIVTVRFAQYMRSGDVAGTVEFESGWTNKANYSATGGTLYKATLMPDKRTVVIEFTGTISVATLTIPSGVTNTNSVSTSADLTPTIQ